MPLFEFKCPACGATREVLQRYDAAAPYCMGSPNYAGGPVQMERQISAPAFSVNGFNAKNGYSSGGGPA